MITREDHFITHGGFHVISDIYQDRYEIEKCWLLFIEENQRIRKNPRGRRKDWTNNNLNSECNVDYGSQTPFTQMGEKCSLCTNLVPRSKLNIYPLGIFFINQVAYCHWQSLKMWTLHPRSLKSFLTSREKVHRQPSLTTSIWTQLDPALGCVVFK